MKDTDEADPPDYEYDVALSFAGEDRGFVEAVATHLRDCDVRVFYDEFLKAELWGKDLFQHLASVYRDRAKFCIIFVSKAYRDKAWPKHELRQAQERSLFSADEYILPILIDDVELELQKEQDKFIRERKAEFEKQEAELHGEILQEKLAITAREKDLDDRTNMHARRSIRADIKRQLQTYASDFSLSSKTKAMRLPVHLTILAIVLGTAGLIGELLFRSPNLTDYFVMGRMVALSAVCIGALAWYIRWLNSWFERHAAAELNLKQFELDVDRASWVVETAMEWRSSQHGVIPSHLLESISRNLFIPRENNKDENIHPADYVASALFGSASKARIKVGDSELELDRKGIRKLEKEP